MIIRTQARAIPVGVACACMASLLLLTPVGRSLDDWFTDACFVIRGGRATGASVVIIAIRDTSRPEDRQGGLTLGDRRVPLDAEGRMRINYVGPPGSFPVLSLGEVLGRGRRVSQGGRGLDPGAGRPPRRPEGV